jgi:hypothetical protein
MIQVGDHSLNSNGNWLWLGGKGGSFVWGDLRGLATNQVLAAKVQTDAIQIKGGAGAGKLLASDSVGNASWKYPVITDWQCNQPGTFSPPNVCQLGTHTFCALGEVHQGEDCDLDVADLDAPIKSWILTVSPAGHTKCDAWCMDY